MVLVAPVNNNNMKTQLKELIDKYGIEAINNELDLFEYTKDTPKSTPEEWLKKLLSEMTIKQDPEYYPNSLFFLLGDEIYMEQNKKHNNLWVNYDKLWSILESNFNLNNQEINDLIKLQVEKHFKMVLISPIPLQGNWHIF